MTTALLLLAVFCFVGLWEREEYDRTERTAGDFPVLWLIGATPEQQKAYWDEHVAKLSQKSRDAQQRGAA